MVVTVDELEKAGLLERKHGLALSERGRAWLDVLAHGLLTLASATIAWRTVLYTLEAHENMEVSTLLLVPLWQPVMLLVPSFVLLTLTALYRMTISLNIATGASK